MLIKYIYMYNNKRNHPNKYIFNILHDFFNDILYYIYNVYQHILLRFDFHLFIFLKCLHIVINDDPK